MGDDEIGAITGVAFPYVVGNHRAVVDVLVVGVDFCLQLGYQSFAVALFCSGLVAHGKLGFGNEVGLLCLGLFYLLWSCGLTGRGCRCLNSSSGLLGSGLVLYGCFF